MRLGSRVAVALAGSYGSDLTPSLGTSTCCGSGPRKDKKKKRTQSNGSYHVLGDDRGPDFYIYCCAKQPQEQAL